MLHNQLSFISVKHGVFEITTNFTKVGNPNFKSKWYGLDTEPLRVPKVYKTAVINFCNELYEKPKVLLETQSISNVTQSKPSKVCEYPVSEIHCDPKRFQFKLFCNIKTGASDKLKGIEVFNHNLAGIVLVWLDPSDNNVYIVNGHHRLDLAKRLNVDSLAVRFIEASNYKEARIIGAMANIAEGNGSVLDASKLFRDINADQKILNDNGIKINGNLAGKALKIASLSDHLWEKYLTNELSEQYAIAIGSIENLNNQEKFYQLLLKEKRTINQDVLNELTQLVLNSETNCVTELDLFGTSTFTDSLAIERCELTSYIETRLKKEKSLFKLASSDDNAGILERGNNHIEVNCNKELVKQSHTALELFTQFKIQSGRLSQLLNEYTKLYINSNNKNKVKTDLYNKVLDLLTVENIFTL